MKLFSNSVLLNWGKVSVSQQIIPWEQPTLTANNQNGYIITTNNTHVSGPPYGAFDGTTSTYWFNNTPQGWLNLAMPEYIYVTGIKIYSKGYSAKTFSGRIYTDSDKNTPIGDSFSVSYGSTHTITNIPTNGVYTNNIYIQKTGTDYDAGIGEVYITAYTLTEEANLITLPCSYTNTNYSFSLANVGNYITSYATTKSITDIHLINSQAASGTMNYMTIGY